VRWEKVACWSTKAAISLKCVKIDEKLVWRVYRKSPTLFRMVPFPNPYAPLFPRLEVRNPRPKLQSLLSHDFIFGQYIHRVHPNKSPLKILENRDRGHIQGLPKFFGAPPIISGRGKVTNFQFCTHIYRLNRNKSPLKISEKVAVGVVRDSQKFSAHPCIGLCDSSAFLYSMRSKY